MSYIKFNNITTINEFKLFLFHFHNKINSKLNKPIFELSELDKKYSQANIKIIYKNFLIVFSSNSNIPQLMSQTFHRKYVLAQIKETLDRIMLKIN